MNATGVALALFIGMLLPLQSLINASLGRQTFGPVFASLASFMVGTGVLLAWWLLTRPVFVPAALAKVPWWAWMGGVIGALFVASATLLVPRLGAASLIVALSTSATSWLANSEMVVMPRPWVERPLTGPPEPVSSPPLAA